MLQTKSVQNLMTDWGLSVQKSVFCKKYCNFVAETLIIRLCRFEYAVNRLFFSAHSYRLLGRIYILSFTTSYQFRTPRYPFLA